MKKIILTAVVALASLTANAQIWVGGGIGFTHTDNEDFLGDPDFTTFYVAPEIGYTLNDKWDLAIALGDVYSKPDPGDATNDFFVNPYARYTFFKTGKVGFFVDGGFSLTAGDSPTQFSIGLRPGVKFAASDKVTFVASFGFLGYKSIEDNSTEFGFELNGNGPIDPLGGGGLKFGCYYSF